VSESCERNAMGVHGLWKLLESTGKPINPETLEGKILSVDISIWLNQAVKGVRDRDGNSVQNAHLLTLFHRLCKLLFFRVRPVFVYDGDAPLLKKQTLAIRRQRKEEMALESKQTNEKLLRTFLKRQAIKAALGDRSQETVPSISSVRRDEEDDMYVLPALPPVEEKERSSSDEEVERGGDEMPETYLRFQEEFYEDPSSVDINSEEFSLLTPEIKHEILKEMKEFTKRRRTLYHKPPERSGDFSQYQLAGLLQRNNLNQRLEGVEKEMSQRSCGPMEEQYSHGEEHSVEARRLVSEDSSHYILIKGPQKAVKAPEHQVVATPWSSGPWSRRGRPKGRPEPLWRPVSDDILEENDPSSTSSSSSATPKPTISVEEQPSDGAPPSPRTLQAIQAAMMDTSSDEDEGVSRKAVQRSRATSSQDENGSVSPRTLEAIQRAMMEDDTSSTKDQTQQRKYVVITSSEDEDGEEISEISILPKTQEESGGGVSPQTLLAIQKSLGESVSKHVEQQDHSTSSEGEEMEKVVGIRSRAFRSAVITEGEEHRQDEKKSIPDDARRTVFLDESDEEMKHDPQLVTPHVHHHTSFPSQEEICKESDLPENLETSTDQTSLDVHKEKQEEERKEQITAKSEEEEDSGSEEDFIEVSEGEEVSGLDDSVTEAKEQLTSQAKELDVNKINEEKKEEANEEADSSDRSLHLNQSETEKQDLSKETTDVPASSEWDNIDTEELAELERDLQAEQSSLHEQQQQLQRSAATVTGQMCQESQELLRLFGVPFLVAPMEAEAQCAALDRTDQTHGTITDDSDIWLFGGRHVYKNFFSNNKYVEHFQYVDIQNQLGLDRTKMINLAYLLGSDYTEGIPGVGYVTGMEILNEFPGPGLEPLTQLSPRFCFSRFGWNSKKTEEILQPVLKQLNTQQTQLRIDSFFRLEQQEKQAIRSQRLRRAVTCLKRKEREGGSDEEESDEDEKQVSPVKKGKKENAKEGDTNSTATGAFGGGFIGSDVHTDILEDKIEDDECSGSVSRVPEEKQPTPSQSKPSKVDSTSSSSSEDERENSYGAAMVTARSVFEGKTGGRGRGRGRRGGRGGRGKTKKGI
ncbi:hypothetical protein NFI96_011391, partial [Prochilodus magdalenae]